MEMGGGHLLAKQVVRDAADKGASPTASPSDHCGYYHARAERTKQENRRLGTD